MSPRASTRPRRSRLGLVIFVAVLGFGAYKLIGLLGGPATGKLAFRPLPYVMFGFKPDFTRSGEPARSTNSLGFRGVEIAVPKPAGTYRVVCLGGSTTYSFAVDDDETYPVRLAEELAAARPDLQIEVINAGVESYTTAESLANLAFRVLDLQPDAIVVYHAANDYRVRRYANFENGYAHYRRPWDGSVGSVDKRDDEINGINALIQQIPPDDTWGDTRANAAAAGTEAFRRNLTSLVGLAEVHGILPVLVTFAASVDPREQAAAGLAAYNTELRAGIREHNDVIRAVCAEQDVLCIDIADEMPTGPEYFADSIHTTAAGCSAKARLIARELAPRLP